MSSKGVGRQTWVDVRLGLRTGAPQETEPDLPYINLRQSRPFYSIWCSIRGAGWPEYVTDELPLAAGIGWIADRTIPT